MGLAIVFWERFVLNVLLPYVSLSLAFLKWICSFPRPEREIPVQVVNPVLWKMCDLGDKSSSGKGQIYPTFKTNMASKIC